LEGQDQAFDPFIWYVCHLCTYTLQSSFLDTVAAIHDVFS
jgi:hypothetical protein